MIKTIDLENNIIHMKDGSNQPLSNFKLYYTLDKMHCSIKRWARKKSKRIEIHKSMMNGNNFPKLDDSEME